MIWMERNGWFSLRVEKKVVGWYMCLHQLLGFERTSDFRGICTGAHVHCALARSKQCEKKNYINKSVSATWEHPT